jgi:hypothetical protein
MLVCQQALGGAEARRHRSPDFVFEAIGTGALGNIFGGAALMLLVKERREQPPLDHLNHITTSNVRAGRSRQNRHDPSRSARSMPNELVDRTGLPEAISKRNGLPITRKDYSLNGLPLPPDAEESARIRLRSARKAAGSEELRISSPNRTAPGNPTRFAGWKRPPKS